MENKIKIIYGSPYHPQSQGSVEAFNKTIINKLEYIRLEEGNKFNVYETIKKAFKMYNNTIHRITKIEPEKAFKFKNKKNINKLIENVVKSQINKSILTIPV